jgi:hypothetical protein
VGESKDEDLTEEEEASAGHSLSEDHKDDRQHQEEEKGAEAAGREGPGPLKGDVYHG